MDAAAAFAGDVLGRYDWAEIAARTEAVYEEVLRGRRRRADRGETPPT
jgi:hypothetical protein